MSALLGGNICKSCNEGWMSQLEARTKPLLIPLMGAETRVQELSALEREQLARWALKTAFVLHVSSNYTQQVDARHLRSLYAGLEHLPPGIVVAGGQHQNSEPFFWYQSPTWWMSAEDDQARMDAGSYKIALSFGSLLLLVAYWPHDGWEYQLRRGIHDLLWAHDSTPVSSYLSDEPFRSDLSPVAVFDFLRQLRAERVESLIHDVLPSS